MAYDITKFSPRSGRIIGEDGKIYNMVDLLQSTGGGTSMEFLFGSAAPESTTGKTGDVYLNTANGDFYKKTDAWTKIGVLKGPQGNPGTDGADGVGITDITSDGTNITFHLSDSTTKVIPWPAQ